LPELPDASSREVARRELVIPPAARTAVVNEAAVAHLLAPPELVAALALVTPRALERARDPAASHHEHERDHGDAPHDCGTSPRGNA
jgi:hypothetical protein